MEQYKILFAGLANAGKTSIVLTLKRQFSDLSGIKPTKGIERSEMDILGFKIITWDCGGQDIYRSEYKKREEIIFSETQIIYFLIDLQDTDAYEEALQYLKEIVEVYKPLDPENIPYFVICLNKMDPDLIEDYSMQTEKLSEDLKNILNGFKYKVFKTSIYNLQSVIEAFSWGISKFLPKQSEIKLILKQFLQEFPSIKAVNLLEKHSMYLIPTFRDEKSHSFFNLVKEGLISIIENLGKGLNILSFDINQIYKLYVEKLNILQRDYYFFFMGGEDMDYETIQISLLNKYYGKIQDILKREMK
ncbi:MAG: ADP-ribosylation factor-like protein [Promethearchaeota archaeon]